MSENTANSRSVNTAGALQGLTAMVVGGSRGIGAAIVKRLAADGANVAFTYHGSASAAEALAASIDGADAIKCDSGDAEALSEAVDQVAASFGSVDILVYNAGVGLQGTVDEMTLADFDRTYAVNVRGAFVAAQAASRHLKEGGRIIFIGSNVTQRAAFGGASAYVMSKSAIAGLGRGLSQDFASRRITVNTVQPGPVDTDMNPADGPNSGRTLDLIPLGRFGETPEIASLVAYLAGPESAFITGAALTIDGGYSV